MPDDRQPADSSEPTAAGNTESWDADEQTSEETAIRSQALTDAAKKMQEAFARNESPDAVGPEQRQRIEGYEILAELGRGGMGVVFKARQTRLNRVVAIKMILGGGYAGREFRQRFLNEADAVSKLEHANIIRVYDLGESEGQVYFVMEFVGGGDLTRLTKSPLSAREIAGLVETLARAIEFAHQRGIIHRDLKPANVLLDDKRVPKITDFGLAKQIAREAGEADDAVEPGLTATGQVLGTPSYMAPEQASGAAKEIGPAADIYALGAILYELLTGRVPFRGQSAVDTLNKVIHEPPVAPRKVQRDVPRDLETIVLKCLEKNPDQRYATAEQLADDLARWQRGDPIQARRHSMAYRLARKAVRHRKPIAFVVAAAAIVLCVWYWAVFIRIDPHVALRKAEVQQEYERVIRTQPRVVDTPHPSRRFVDELPAFDPHEFEQVSRFHIWDLRAWQPLPADQRGGPGSAVVLTRRQRLRKLKPVDTFRFEMRTTGLDVYTRCSTHPDKFYELASDAPVTVGGSRMKGRQIVLDVSDVAVNEEFNVETTHTYWNAFQGESDWWIGAIVKKPTLNISFLVVFPEDRPLQDFQLRIADLDGPAMHPYDGEQLIIQDDDGKYVFWECVRPRSGHVYRIDWRW